MVLTVKAVARVIWSHLNSIKNWNGAFIWQREDADFRFFWNFILDIVVLAEPWGLTSHTSAVVLLLWCEVFYCPSVLWLIVICTEISLAGGKIRALRLVREHSSKGCNAAGQKRTLISYLCSYFWRISISVAEMWKCSIRGEEALRMEEERQKRGGDTTERSRQSKLKKKKNLTEWSRKGTNNPWIFYSCSGFVLWPDLSSALRRPWEQMKVISHHIPPSHPSKLGFWYIFILSTKI